MRHRVKNKITEAISHRLDRLVMLVCAIKICHQLRDKPLDVKDHGSFYSYDYYEDAGNMEYIRNRSIIQKYPRLAKALNWFI